VIRFENVSKTYKNGSPALKDITLDIEKESSSLGRRVGIG